MAEKMSTGFRDKTNTTGSVKAVMANGCIDIYSGSQPATADTAEVGTLLARLTRDAGAFTPGEAANGLNMGNSTGGVLSKAAGEVWRGIGKAEAGDGIQAGWYRWRENADTGGASTSFARADGAIGSTSAFELRLSNTVIAAGVPVEVTVFSFTKPASA